MPAEPNAPLLARLRAAQRAAFERLASMLGPWPTSFLAGGTAQRAHTPAEDFRARSWCWFRLCRCREWAHYPPHPWPEGRK